MMIFRRKAFSLQQKQTKSKVMLLYTLYLDEKQHIFYYSRFLTFISASSEPIMTFLYQFITKLTVTNNE